MSERESVCARATYAGFVCKRALMIGQEKEEKERKRDGGHGGKRERERASEHMDGRGSTWEFENTAG